MLYKYISLSRHPLDMLYELLGENLFRKLALIVIVAGIMSALYFLAPMIVSQVYIDLCPDMAYIYHRN